LGGLRQVPLVAVESLEEWRSDMRIADDLCTDTQKELAKGEYSVVIAGGGPTGLMLAAELALAGVGVVIVERRANQDVAGSRAGGLKSRTIEILDQRGIAERFVSQGQLHKFVHFHIPLDMSDSPTRHNYVLGLWQKHIERILADWVSELQVPVIRGCEVTGFAQDNTGVVVELSDGKTLRTQYLVGCDGGRSLIRKKAGIDFLGWDPTTSWLMIEAETAEQPPMGFRHDATGTHGIGQCEDGQRLRMVLTEPNTDTADEPTLQEVSEALIRIYGSDYGVHSPTWMSRFTDMTRQAACYRKERVLLAGDAAHVHPPVGGHGLNLGVQDAFNLGWKLAQVIKGTSSPDLLNSYQAERHPVGYRVLRNTMAQMALRRPDDRTKALGEYASELFNMEQPRRRWAAEMSGLDIHYDFGEGHPLLGRRMPDLDLIGANGPLRTFSLLHKARPVLLNLGEPGSFDLGPWANRVHLTEAKCTVSWELPVLGAVEPPLAVLIRPDGYVAWVGDRGQSGLVDALTRWFGEASAA
jgi:3-(3-hydroxy-phenyl)propionate hydroxylase